MSKNQQTLLTEALKVFDNNKKIIEENKKIVESCNNKEDVYQSKIMQIQHSNIIPKELHGKTKELVELQKFADYRKEPLVVLLNNILFIDGKMGWKSTYIISKINSATKRFLQPLNYRSIGEEGKPSFGKIAYTYDVKGNLMEGPAVTLDIAEKSGWTNKDNSSWNTIPELMLTYRAATFFGRIFCPDLFDGLHTSDELVDIYSASGTLPLQAIDEQIMEIINETKNTKSSVKVVEKTKENKEVKLEKLQKDIKRISTNQQGNLSPFERLCNDIEDNDFLVSNASFYKGKFFIKAEPIHNNIDMNILLKFGFNKTKKSSYILDVTSLLNEEEKQYANR